MSTGHETKPVKQWQMILKRQATANVHRWLHLLNSKEDPTLFLAQNYDNILRSLETILPHEEQLNLTLELIKAISPFIFNFADWDRWLTYLDKALAQTIHCQQIEDQAYLLIEMGAIHQARGEWQKALDHFEQSERLYLQLNLSVKYARALNRRGVMLCSLGQIGESLKLCQQALSLAEEFKAEDIVAEARWNLTAVYQKAHLWEKALLTAREAIVHYQQNASNASRHTLQRLIIISLSKLGRSEETATQAQLLLDELTQAGEIQKLAALQVDLGVIAFEQNNYRVAEKHWYEALQLYSQIQNPHDQAVLHNNLGYLYTKLEEWETAEVMLLQAIRIYAELGDTYNQVDTMDNLAELYEAQNKGEARGRVLAQAIHLLEQVDRSPTPYYQELFANLQGNTINCVKP